MTEPRQKSLLPEQFRRAKAMLELEGKGLGDMVLALMRYDRQDRVSRDMGMKHTTAKFHIAREPKPEQKP